MGAYLIFFGLLLGAMLVAFALFDIKSELKKIKQQLEKQNEILQKERK